jgi:hypothetical protein
LFSFCKAAWRDYTASIDYNLSKMFKMGIAQRKCVISASILKVRVFYVKSRFHENVVIIAGASRGIAQRVITRGK